jgi:DNA (cytosine-5)-methyltransferase 1
VVFSLNNFTFIDLFAGIGGIRLPFEDLGGKCVFTSEWDKFAQITYEANFGELPQGDITKIHTDEIPTHDILLGGFPCQAFSIMGKSLGFADTRGTLFFEIERILKVRKPKAFLLENVKQLRGHDKGRTLQVIISKLEQIGYKVKWEILNALNFGLPQKRERIIIVGFLDHSIEFDFPKGSNENRKTLADILEPDELVDKKYFASDKIIKNRLEKVAGKEVFEPAVWHENKAGDVSVNDFSCALRAGASYNYLLVNGKRRFTPKELLRLQGFPEGYKVVVSDQQIRKQTGNSVPVPVIRAVANEMMKCLKKANEVKHEKELSEVI